MYQYYLALVPEKKLIDLINQQKRLIEETLGNQIYLHHPPHLTLIILTTDSLEEIIDILQRLSKNINKFKIQLKDFHVFYNDSWTKGNTITYSLSEEDIESLKKIQLQVINSINQFNTKKFNYPFIGNEWMPHITLASIEPEKFNIIFEKIKQNPIQGEFTIDSINLYKVGQETSFLIKSFELQ